MKAELLTRYDQYITDEVLPLIRKDCGDGEHRPLTTGASLGAFLSANAYFKHPDLFRGVIAMSGSYDVRSYLKDTTTTTSISIIRSTIFPTSTTTITSRCCARPTHPDHVRAGKLRSPGTQSHALRHSERQRHSSHAGPLGQRCGPRLALVAQDAAVRFGQVVIDQRAIRAHPWRVPARLLNAAPQTLSSKPRSARSRRDRSSGPRSQSYWRDK